MRFLRRNLNWEETGMNYKRFWLAVVAVFVATNVFGILIHGTLLLDDYSALPNLMRTPEEASPYMPFMFLGMASSSLALVWIYAQGVSKAPWLGQGIRFGMAVWALTAVPMFLIYYAVSPFPGILVVKQIGYEFGAVTILGIIAAAVYRPGPAR
jgi:hypothetical protein